MSVATATRGQNGSQAKDQVEDFSNLLDKAIQNTPLSQRTKGMEVTLLKGVEKLRASMPENLKGQAERLIRRAIIYIQMSPMLDDATPQSLMMCVLKAAEMGLPLDGKMCHAVVFNNKHKDGNGKEYWVKEAVPMPDYRGLVAVAKRTGLIEDIFADVVCEGDTFNFNRTGDKDSMYHDFDLMAPREKVVGAYCKVKPKGADWRFEVMTRKDIDAIRNKSKGKERGPWKDPDSSDWRQMAKKTVLRRVLQLFYEDPGLAVAIDVEDSQYSLDEAGIIPEAPPKRQKLSEIAADEPIPEVSRPRQSETQPPSHTLADLRKIVDEAGYETGEANEAGTIIKATIETGFLIIRASTTEEDPAERMQDTQVVMADEADADVQLRNVIDRAKRKAAKQS